MDKALLVSRTKKVRQLLDEKGWVRGNFAVDKDENMVPLSIPNERPKAAAFCLIGAWDYVSVQDGQGFSEAVADEDDFAKFLGFKDKSDAMSFNDNRAGSKEFVLARLDSVLAQEEHV